MLSEVWWLVFAPITSTCVCLGLGFTTGFLLRDELTMPTYLRIKMSTVEYFIQSRQQMPP